MPRPLLAPLLLLAACGFAVTPPLETGSSTSDASDATAVPTGDPGPLPDVPDGAPTRVPCTNNFGDALTAVPLGIAFFLRSFRAEKIAGLAVVLAIFISACVALYETIQRFLNPEDLTHLWGLAAAGVIGFAGNELAAQVRLRAGRRLSSPALVADGNHARIDGFVSLGVVASAIIVALGAPIGDPIVGLLITLVIFKITWDSWRLVSTTDPGEMLDDS